jgi:hypothetical protein
MQFLIMATMVMPLLSMQYENAVQIKGDISVISIPKSNLVLMKALNRHCQDYYRITKRRGIVQRYQHVCSDEICLVDKALTVRPDKFTDYYNKLSKQDRLLLIKVSGQYNEDGKKVMLDVPEVTKRLIEVYFTDEGLRNHIKKNYLNNEDEDYVRNYFKEQLIYSKSGLFLKESMHDGLSSLLTKNIYLGSLFFNGCHTVHPHQYPVSLYTGDRVRQTYAICFAFDNYEYRITDVENKQCLLWVINHDNPSDTFSTCIKHKGDIKGSCFSTTKDDVEGVLTYSDHDMVFSTITMLNGLSFVESVSVDSPNFIVDVRFEPDNSEWRVATYEGRDNVYNKWSMLGIYKGESSRNSFRTDGLLEKLVTYQTESENYMASICGVADLYAIEISEANGNGRYYLKYNKGFASLGHYEMYNSEYTLAMLKVGDSVEMFHSGYPFFADQTGRDSWSQPKSEVHRVYSPNGEFLMCNSLKNKWGMRYIETVIQDAVTRKPILSLDTLYAGFKAVGFSHDSTELIFLDNSHCKVSLLNYEDKQVLFQIEDKACTNLGVASLVKRLCMERKENGAIALQNNDSTYAMLFDWTRTSPELLQLLKTCLPIRTVKK